MSTPLPRFIYKNLLRDAEILAVSSEAPQFPVENLQDDNLDAELSWRSRYGSGSGNGRFVVVAGSNSKIDFDEGGAELTATLTAGAYNGQTLAAEIKTRMDAAGGTYTVTYDESTGKFTIASGSNFTIRWQSGTNSATNAAGLLGFSKAADDTGAATYTSDTMVIHSSEEIDFDLGAAAQYDSISILGHNLTASAVVTVYGADDSAFSSNVVSDVLTHNDNNIFEFLAAARTKRYIRIKIVDVANPSGYIKICVALAGAYFEMGRYNGPLAADGPVDESEIEKSPGNVVFTVHEREMLTNRDYTFTGISSANAATIKLLLAEIGFRKGFWLCMDSTAANTNSYWIRLRETIPPAQEAYNRWSWEMPTEEIA